MKTLRRYGGNWELRPGGMLIQKRDDGSDPDYHHRDGVLSAPTMKIKVSQGSNQYDLTVPSQSTLGNKRNLSKSKPLGQNITEPQTPGGNFSSPWCLGADFNEKKNGREERDF